MVQWNWTAWKLFSFFQESKAFPVAAQEEVNSLPDSSTAGYFKTSSPCTTVAASDSVDPRSGKEIEWTAKAGAWGWGCGEYIKIMELGNRGVIQTYKEWHIRRYEAKHHD